MVRHLIASIFTVVVAALAGATALVSQSQAVAPADLVLYNGRIATLETPATVQALAARGGRIVALGSDADVKRYNGQGPEAIDRAYRYHRARRNARVRRKREKSNARLRFLVTFFVLVGLAVFLMLTTWSEVQRVFGL